MKKYGLVGEKLGHSLSPKIHEYIFKKEGIEGEYKLYEIPRDKSDDIIEIMRNNGLEGFNITIPYKEIVMKKVDVLSYEAEKIGAINVVKFKDGKSYGYNSDYYGVINMFENSGIKIDKKICYVLGSGGASKAVIVALKDMGAKEIVVVTRDVKKNKSEFQKRFKDVEMVSYEEIIGGDIIINTTPVGMFPNINFSPIEETLIKRFDVAVDVIYNPVKTKFLQLASSNGLKTVGGLDMLIEQGIKAEEIWQEMNFEKILGRELSEILKDKECDKKL